jgi:hypothetical protein
MHFLTATVEQHACVANRSSQVVCRAICCAVLPVKASWMVSLAVDLQVKRCRRGESTKTDLPSLPVWPRTFVSLIFPILGCRYMICSKAVQLGAHFFVCSIPALRVASSLWPPQLRSSRKPPALRRSKQQQLLLLQMHLQLLQLDSAFLVCPNPKVDAAQMCTMSAVVGLVNQKK